MPRACSPAGSAAWRSARARSWSTRRRTAARRTRGSWDEARCAASPLSCAPAGGRTARRSSGWARRWRRAGRAGTGSWWAGGARAPGRRGGALPPPPAPPPQPMRDAALGLTVVFNGCIYNHRELRAELERAGHAFRSASDTEVLLKGWAEWGEALLDRLAGMFAFCLVEERTGRAVLARDRLGVKPLYLSELAGGGLRAASTLPALLAAGGVDTSVDPVALHHYLSWHSVVPAPR